MATAPLGGAPVRLPSKIVGISQLLDNETVVDPDFMRPSIRDVTGKENAKLMCELFPGLRLHRRLLPLQDQGGFGRLDPRGRAVRLKAGPA